MRHFRGADVMDDLVKTVRQKNFAVSSEVQVQFASCVTIRHVEMQLGMQRCSSGTILGQRSFDDGSHRKVAELRVTS